MKKFLAWGDRFLSSLTRKTLIILVILVVLLLGILDYATSYEISFSLFYLIPIAIATWYLGRTEGRIAALIGAFTRTLSNRLSGEQLTREIYLYVNAATRLAVFILFVELLFELKDALRQEQALARADFLTGIPNRREFYNRAELEILQARRYGHPLTVAILDIDAFKQVNDTRGHHQGDALLQLMAQTIASAIRRTDLVARMGGDEFALLLPNTDQDGTRCVLEKVKDALTRRLDEEGFRATYSLGAVTFPTSPASIDEMLRSADRLMYHVKEGGKDGIEFQRMGG